LKILLLSAGTGGGEMFHVLSQYLKANTKHCIYNVSLNTIAKAVNPNSHLFTTIPQVVSLSPDVVIYETSNNNSFRDIILGIFQGKCPIVSIMDVFDETNRRFKKIVPDLICAPTPTIEKQMRGFGYENVWTYTNPAFASLANLKKNTDPKKRTKNCINVLYASQGESFRYALVDTVKKMENTNVPFNLYIKPHPEESYAEEFLEECLGYKQVFKGNLEMPLYLKEGFKSNVWRSCSFLNKNPFKDIETLLLQYDLIA